MRYFFHKGARSKAAVNHSSRRVHGVDGERGNGNENRCAKSAEKKPGSISAVVPMLAESVPAVQTLMVVEDVVVNDFTQSGADSAARCTTEQGTQNCASDDAECGTGWTGNDQTQGATDFRAAHDAGGATSSASERAYGATCLLCEPLGVNAVGSAARAVQGRMWHEGFLHGAMPEVENDVPPCAQCA